MRIALVRNHESCVNTRQLEFVRKRAGVLPHLGLGYIHSAIQARGHSVRTIDAQALSLDRDGLHAALKAFEPELVGVTTTTPGLPGAVDACSVAKNLGCTTILGGPHTEVFGWENLFHECIDYVGVGEGVSIVPDLADALDGKGGLPAVPGLISRDFSNPPAPMLSLSDMAWPDRQSIPLHSYHSIMALRPFATMISSRGCPFKCSFCFKQAVDTKSVFRSPEDVVSEMEYLVAGWNVREIMFYDDVFTMKKSRVYEICDLIRRRGLSVRWEAPTRVDLVDETLLEAMRSAGCIRLRFGIESGDEGILRLMKKESNLAVIEEAVRAAKRVGLQTFGYFIVGWLGETSSQYERTVSLARELPLDYASFYTATPLPGTDLHSKSVEAGLVSPDYWLRFVEGSAPDRIGFLVPDAEHRARQAYRSFYYRWSKVPTIAARLTNPTATWDVLSGLARLTRSATNQHRDV